MLTGLTISGWLAVKQSSDRLLKERKALAQSSASYLEYILRQNLARLSNLPLLLVRISVVEISNLKNRRCAISI